jgi:ankyrin repeat protein
MQMQDGVFTPNDKLGFSLTVAVMGNNATACRRALAKGADVNWRGLDHMPALHRAAKDGNVALVRLLIKAGADVNLDGGAGVQPLHAAMDSNARVDVARVLLAAGANSNCVTDAFSSPLGRACGSGDVQLIALLIENGADVEYVSGRGGRSMNHFQSSVLWNQPASVQALAQLCKIDFDQVTESGETLHDLALASGSKSMVSLVHALKAESAARMAIGSIEIDSPSVLRAGTTLSPI